MTLTEEEYLVRVQLIRSDKEGEYVSKSFDYQVSPTTDPSLQEPAFLRAERFYKKLQGILSSSGGKVTVTPSLSPIIVTEWRKKAEKYDLISNSYFEVSNDGTTWNTTNLSKVIEAIEKIEAIRTHIERYDDSLYHGDWIQELRDLLGDK